MIPDVVLLLIAATVIGAWVAEVGPAVRVGRTFGRMDRRTKEFAAVLSATVQRLKELQSASEKVQEKLRDSWVDIVAVNGGGSDLASGFGGSTNNHDNDDNADGRSDAGGMHTDRDD